MELLSFYLKTIYLRKIDLSLIFRFIDRQDLWLLNCYEGYQHFFSKHNLKINQISIIFLTNLNIDNISGLLGLLSSLNLMTRIKPISIYGPDGLQYYLDLGKKYSRTNFTYNIYCYLYRSNLLLKNEYYKINYNIQKSKHIYNLSILLFEYHRQFILDKAIKWHLNKGPLYGKLKAGMVFLLPDGTIFDGFYFIFLYSKGYKISIISCLFSSRFIVENSIHARIIAL